MPTTNRDNTPRRIAALLAIAAGGFALAGCQSNAARHHLAMTGPTGTAALHAEFASEFDGPGPSLVAGDRLARRMVLAGAFDLRNPNRNPAADDLTPRFATVPLTDD